MFEELIIVFWRFIMEGCSISLIVEVVLELFLFRVFRLMMGSGM